MKIEIVVSKLNDGVRPSCNKNLDAPSEIISLKLSRHGFNFCLTFIFWSKSVIGIFPVVPPSTICSLLHKLCSKVKKSKMHFLSKSTSMNNWTDSALSYNLWFQTNEYRHLLTMYTSQTNNTRVRLFSTVSKKMYKKNNAICSVYGRNRIIWNFHLGLSRWMRWNDNQCWILRLLPRNFAIVPKSLAPNLCMTNGSKVLVYLTLLYFILYCTLVRNAKGNIAKSINQIFRG